MPIKKAGIIRDIGDTPDFILPCIEVASIPDLSYRIITHAIRCIVATQAGFRSSALVALRSTRHGAWPERRGIGYQEVEHLNHHIDSPPLQAAEFAETPHPRPLPTSWLGVKNLTFLIHPSPFLGRGRGGVFDTMYKRRDLPRSILKPPDAPAPIP